MSSSLEILGSDGAPLIKERQDKPRLSRATRRRLLRDPDYRNKVIAGTEGVPPYYRLLAYGQVLVAQMSDIQARMMGIPFARTKKGDAREKYQEQLTAEWNECVEKLEAVQKDVEHIEIMERLKEHPEEEAEIYGLC